MDFRNHPAGKSPIGLLYLAALCDDTRFRGCRTWQDFAIDIKLDVEVPYITVHSSLLGQTHPIEFHPTDGEEETVPSIDEMARTLLEQMEAHRQALIFSNREQKTLIGHWRGHDSVQGNEKADMLQLASESQQYTINRIHAAMQSINGVLLGDASAPPQ
jgi:hypothetical protein